MFRPWPEALDIVRVFLQCDWDRGPMGELIGISRAEAFAVAEAMDIPADRHMALAVGVRVMANVAAPALNARHRRRE